MNIFAVDDNPIKASTYLHPKLLVKMPLESCQMLAAAFSEYHLNWGKIHKKDGSEYKVAFRNHPCTVWITKSYANMAWLIVHAQGILENYTKLYNKVHACQYPLNEAYMIFAEKTGECPYDCWAQHERFVVAAPQEFKEMSDPIEAYRKYMYTKPYIKNWVKYPQLKPDWWVDNS
jgi:hypothetical protein